MGPGGGRVNPPAAGAIPASGGFFPGCGGDFGAGGAIAVAASAGLRYLAALVPARSHKKGLRLVALFEALKGTVVLIIGFGLLSALGQDVENLAERMVRRSHLDPLDHYPRIFIEVMSHLNDRNLWLLAAFAAFYSLIRFCEAYGLWRQRRWAEWLAALSGGVYVPFEIFELLRHASWLRALALIVNLAIVCYMAWLLIEARRSKSLLSPAPQEI